MTHLYVRKLCHDCSVIGLSIGNRALGEKSSEVRIKIQKKSCGQENEIDNVVYKMGAILCGIGLDVLVTFSSARLHTTMNTSASDLLDSMSHYDPNPSGQFAQT